MRKDEDLMVKYEAPRIKFDNLTFFEKIACDECWSAKEIYFDKDNDNVLDCGEDLWLVGRNKCNYADTLAVLGQIKQILNKKYKQWEKKIGGIDIKSSSAKGIKILES